VISILGLEVTMPQTDARSVATRFLEAWSSGDFETTEALLHENVTFTGPLGVTQAGMRI
jgi:ketosteroid isomerase-like protein